MLILTGVELFIILGTAVVQIYCIKNLFDNRLVVWLALRKYDVYDLYKQVYYKNYYYIKIYYIWLQIKDTHLMYKKTNLLKNKKQIK